MKRLMDGQFDECDLTLRQLHIVEESLIKSLGSMYHARVPYPETEAPDAATSLVGDMRLLIPLAGQIDKDAELARLNKNIARHEQDAERISAKLANENFVSRAPAEVVDKEKDKLAETESALASLRQQAERIAAI